MISIGIQRRSVVLNQLGIIMHKWATARKSGGPRTSVYFENGFACRIRLRNTGSYKQPYAPIPVK